MSVISDFNVLFDRNEIAFACSFPSFRGLFFVLLWRLWPFFLKTFPLIGSFGHRGFPFGIRVIYTSFGLVEYPSSLFAYPSLIGWIFEHMLYGSFPQYVFVTVEIDKGCFVEFVLDLLLLGYLPI